MSWSSSVRLRSCRRARAHRPTRRLGPPTPAPPRPAPPRALAHPERRRWWSLRCAAQSVWRGHMARALAVKLRWEKQGRLKRSFSWSRGKKGPPKPGSAAKPSKSNGLLSPRGNPTPGKPVKRASSFDRFMRKSSSKDPGGAAPAAAAQQNQTFSKQLLFILLSRGPNGLGLELDATNTVINVVKGGAADAQGYFRVNDTIASVDGIPLRGRLLQVVAPLSGRPHHTARHTCLCPSPPSRRLIST